MKKLFILPLLALATLISCSQTETKEAKSMELKTENDSLSYALGLDIANNLKQAKLDSINVEIMADAMAAVFTGGETKMDPQSAGATIQAFMQKEAKKASAGVIAEGEKFLEENSKKEGVITTASGLQYKVIEEGKGEMPTLESKVKVYYKGTLINGQVFDSNEGKDPIEFGVTQVIAGWTEGLQLMKAGSKYEFYIPYNLAYGERGAGQMIGPYSTLIFEVELISFE
jgi:FKBP-type peptidyl-prolyl cis-trans isomerase FklB